MRFYTDIINHKGKFLVTGYDSNNHKVRDEVRYKPYHFVPSSNSSAPYRSLEGKALDKLDFDSIWEAKEYLKQYKDVHGFEVYGSEKYLYGYIYDNFNKDIDFDLDVIRKLFLDIETDSEGGFPDMATADKEVTAIGCFINGVYTLFSCLPFDNKDSRLEGAVVEHILCKNEIELLLKFLDYWERTDPDILTGWYVAGFDMPYLYVRIKRLLGETQANRLSPWRIVEERTYEQYGKTQTEYTFVGINILDYIDLYKKHSFTPQESYKLDHIAKSELGIGKLDYSEYGDLNMLFKLDPQKFQVYNILDVDRVVKLDEKMRLIDLVCTFAYDSKITYKDTFATVNPWDVIITNYLLDQKIAVPQQRYGANKQIAGGYVKETKPGKYLWTVSLDAASLYPSLIQQYNISPETFRGMQYGITPELVLARKIDTKMLKEQGISLCSNGATFSIAKQGFFAALMEKMYKDRAAYKAKMIEWKNKLQKATTAAEKKECRNNVAKFNNLQQSTKIKLNSAYGACANPGFRFFSTDIAEAITLSGQMTIQWAARALNDYLNKKMKCNEDWVIAVDTDSVTGDTKIYIDGEKITISDFYDSVEDAGSFLRKDEFNGQFVIDLSDLNMQTLTFSEDDICSKPVQYIKKHKVKKVLYKVSVGGNEVIVTEDHGLVVEREGSLIEIKPKDVLESDIFINIIATDTESHGYAKGTN